MTPGNEMVVYGGYNTEPMSDIVVYSSSSGTWRSLGTVSFPRYGHTATLNAKSGTLYKMFIVGGISQNDISQEYIITIFLNVAAGKIGI